VSKRPQYINPLACFGAARRVASHRLARYDGFRAAIETIVDMSDRLLHLRFRSQPASLPPRVETYLDALVRTCAAPENELVSLILFGSAVTGGFSGTVSDVDLILVLSSTAPLNRRRQLRDRVIDLEIRHGVRERPGHSPGLLESVVDRITAGDRSFFICTRDDLLSGNPARILHISRAQAFFVDRVVIPGIIASAVTVWGEDLLPQIPFPPIRRLDVLKACFSLLCQALTAAALFPVLPGATRYAMAALKRSLHHCYFCHHLRPAPLHEEVAFFQSRFGPKPGIEQLLSLRSAYRESYAFVLGCLPTIAGLHLRTALANRFPRPVPAEPAQ
jgi:predicted nucleotidyltransferase